MNQIVTGSNKALSTSRLKTEITIVQRITLLQTVVRLLNMSDPVKGKIRLIEDHIDGLHGFSQRTNVSVLITSSPH
jgi:hypothetical protein